MGIGAVSLFGFALALVHQQTPSVGAPSIWVLFKNPGQKKGQLARLLAHR